MVQMQFVFVLINRTLQLLGGIIKKIMIRGIVSIRSTRFFENPLLRPFLHFESHFNPTHDLETNSTGKKQHLF